MKQRKLFNLNLAQTAGMLSGARRVAMMLLATLFLAMTAQTVRADDVTLLEDPAIPEGTIGHYYLNMPKTGTNTLTLTAQDIAEGKGMFKVYDDGGKNGNYSSNCDGILRIKTPEGYGKNVSGTVNLGGDQDDFLQIGAYNNGLYNEYISSGGQWSSDITTPYDGSFKNTGIRFYSDGADEAAGIDLNVLVYSTNVEYGITVKSVTGGSVIASPTAAKSDDLITLTATPDNNYILSGISVTNAVNNTIEVSGGTWYNNTATFTMPTTPATPVTVTPTFSNTLTGLSVNMPKTGSRTVTIPDGVTSFKVYDDGGEGGHNTSTNMSGNYSNGCDGTLTITATAPEKYELQLTGSVITTSGDYLTVYNGTSTDASNRLGNEKYGEKYNIGTGVDNLIPLYSNGQSLTLYFKSDNSQNLAGLDLTVTLIDVTTPHDVVVNTASGGSVSASPEAATIGSLVTLTASPNDNYALSGITVVDENSVPVDVEWAIYSNTATFVMPATKATVTPVFTNDLSNISFNIPKTGHLKAVFPNGVTTFKVYDDGGASGAYSKNCDGYLSLTAPEGYRLKLTGSTGASNQYDGADYLSVFDGVYSGSGDSPATLGSKGCYSGENIGTLISTNQSMTLLFHSDGSQEYGGIDLTVTLVDASAAKAVGLTQTAGGTIASDRATALTDETVKLTATPEEGYVLSGISVKDGSQNDVAFNWSIFGNTATFSMPASAVTVTPTFTDELADLYINLPANGIIAADIPIDVHSLKVYDDGGANGNFTKGCDGTLTLTAPEGCNIQVTGTVTTNHSALSGLSIKDVSVGSFLLVNKMSTTEGVAENIGTFRSSGRVLQINFETGGDATPDAGLDLTVQLVYTDEWAGSGTSDDPYRIATTRHLDLLATRVNSGTSDYEGKYFKVIEDIAYSTTGLAEVASNYTVIGYSNMFRGHFDGNGKTISGIRINSVDSEQGLFGYVGSSATVSNVILKDAVITGSGNVGGIVANNRGTLSNNLADGVTVTATASPATDSPANYGIIYGYCYSGSNVINNYYLNCSANGATTNIGGNGGDKAVSNGAVSIHTLTLGTGITTRTAAATTYKGTAYYASGTTIQLTATTEGYGLTGCTVNGTAFSGYSFVMPAADATVAATVANVWGDGRDGTAGHPYLITSTAGLDLLADNVNAGTTYAGSYFELGDHITYSTEGLAENESNYTAIGSSNVFSGNFDGKGKTVSGIRIYSDKTYQGLFGLVGDGEVKNIWLSDAIIKGRTLCGGIVGEFDTTVPGTYTLTNCHVDNSVAVSSTDVTDGIAGGIVGIVGRNSSTLSGCTSSANVNGSLHVGGICGRSEGTITNCFSLGATITGTNKVGAVVGFPVSLTINNSGYTYSSTVNGSQGQGLGVGDDDVSQTPLLVSTITTTDENASVSINKGTAVQTYDYEGLTVYPGGISYGGQYYANAGSNVSLTLGHNDRENYSFNGYVASAGELSGNDTDGYSLTMAAEDVTISALWKKLLTNTDITISTIADQTYTGSEIEPTITVKDGETDITGQYNFTYSNNKNAALATATDAPTVTITAKAESAGYAGEATVKFTITPKTVGLSWSESTFDYDGTEKTVTATATGLEGEDVCTVTVTNNTKTAVGAYTAQATALSNANYQLPEDVFCDFNIFRKMENLFADGCSWTFYVAEEDLWASEELGLKAYAITAVDGSTATATEIPLFIPKDVPVLLYRSDNTKNIYRASLGEGAVPTGNLLRVNAADKTVKAGECYVFYKDAFVLTSSGTLPAGRVYLPVSGGASARRLSINVGEATAIEDIRWQMEEGTGDWYSVDGRKLDGKPTKKGVYIKDGRKVVMK